MEYVVYILYSKKYDKTYVGFTTSIISRFHSHNILATKGWTIKYRPWEVAHIEFYYSKKEAIVRERWFKTGVGRRFKDQLLRIYIKN